MGKTIKGNQKENEFRKNKTERVIKMEPFNKKERSSYGQ